MREQHPDLDIEYFFTDTGKELHEVYSSWSNLRASSGSPSCAWIRTVTSTSGSSQASCLCGGSEFPRLSGNPTQRDRL